jgi:hypothetical protein
VQAGALLLLLRRRRCCCNVLRLLPWLLLSLQES